MSFLKEQFARLAAFWRGEYRWTVLFCALGFLGAVFAGALTGFLAPGAVEYALNAFMEMVKTEGIVDVAGNLSALGLLGNNWRAMLLAVLYGFVPFLFLPAFTLGVNGFLIGLMGAWYLASGLPLALFLALLLPHGIFEIPALLLSSACGVTLCRAMGRLVVSQSGRASMVDLLSDLLRVLLLLVAPLLVAAAFMEAYVTPLVGNLFQ